MDVSSSKRSRRIINEQNLYPEVKKKLTKNTEKNTTATGHRCHIIGNYYYHQLHHRHHHQQSRSSRLLLLLAQSRKRIGFVQCSSKLIPAIKFFFFGIKIIVIINEIRIKTKQSRNSVNNKSQIVVNHLEVKKNQNT